MEIESRARPRLFALIWFLLICDAILLFIARMTVMVNLMEEEEERERESKRATKMIMFMMAKGTNVK